VRAVASILSIVVFLAFATSGLQKMIFNTMSSQMAEHLGFTKSSFRRIGVLEFIGGVGVLIGLAARHASTLAWINVAAATGLVLMMLGALAVHLRKGDGVKGSIPALALAALCVVEVVLRLV